MTKQQSIPKALLLGTRLLGTVVALSSLTSLGTASPLGAIGDPGDVYVIARADILGVGFLSPVVKQYDGATGALVGDFAFRIPGQFNGMAWGPNGNLYVSHQVSVGTWGVAEFDGGTGAYIQDVIAVANAGFSAAKGLAFGPAGDLFLGDFFRQTVTRYDGTTFAFKAETPAGEVVGSPSGMHFAPNGNLLVLSGGFQTLREYDISGGGVTYLGDFAGLTGAAQPQDFTWGPNGNIFIARGSLGGVSEVDGANGAYLGEFVPIDNQLPTNGLAFDAYGRLMVSIVYPVGLVEGYDAVTGASTGTFLSAELGGSLTPTLISIKEAVENGGNAFCFGDGTGAACPCSANGNAGEGCANSGGLGGATLVAFGDANFTTDTFGLQVSGIPGSRFGLCMKGSALLGGGNGVFSGDGLLCIASEIRSQVIGSDANGDLTMTDWRGQPFGTYSGAANTASATYYQWWYRDPSNACSGQGFSFTNAWEVVWTP